MTPSAFDRDVALERLGSDAFDLLVVGGGVTGCGVALDAAARGLRTALVEGRDFASGTSSKSSKMVHGGLRYLQQRDFLLVYEALHERQRLIHNAPHLVHPLPFLIPLFGRDGVVSAGVAKAYSSALWLYDMTGGIRIGKRHRRIGREDALAHFPSLRTDRLVASFLYWDAQADDARLVIALARTAADRGAVLANYSPVESLLVQDGRVAGVSLANGTEVRAKAVVNATGVWADGLTSGKGNLRPAKGVHLSVPADKLPCDYAAVLTVPGDRRSIFVVPWAADESRKLYTYIGTTDTDYDGPLDEPLCTGADVDYLLAAVNAWTSAGLTPADITGTWAGLRPLVSDARSARTADLSRRHRVDVGPNGLVTVTGGKLTTYRRMAADAVNAAVSRRGPSTANLRLVGSGPVTAGTSEHLAGRHGSDTHAIVELIDAEPSLAEPLVAGMPYLKAEAVYAARYEMAHTLEDVLARRTRAMILDRDAAARAAPAVAQLIGKELGWDAGEQGRQVDAFLAVVDTERRASTTPVTT